MTEITSDKVIVVESHHISCWQVEKDDGATEYIDAHDEDQCNWMMFVRPAANPAEQNLVTYQHGSDIYFSVIKNIEPRQELKVWRRLWCWLLLSGKFM